MKPTLQSARSSRLRFAAVAGVLVMSAGLAFAADTTLELSGAQEVPAVTTDAKGVSTIKVNEDRTVTGSVKTTGLQGTAAHIHHAPAGKNGPVVIGLTKQGDDEWVVPAGAKLTDEQYAFYKAGELYINVHTEKHRGGEIRAQMKP